MLDLDLDLDRSYAYLTSFMVERVSDSWICDVDQQAVEMRSGLRQTPKDTRVLQPLGQ